MSDMFDEGKSLRIQLQSNLSILWGWIRGRVAKVEGLEDISNIRREMGRNYFDSDGLDGCKFCLGWDLNSWPLDHISTTPQLNKDCYVFKSRERLDQNEITKVPRPNDIKMTREINGIESVDWMMIDEYCIRLCFLPSFTFLHPDFTALVCRRYRCL